MVAVHEMIAIEVSTAAVNDTALQTVLAEMSLFIREDFEQANPVQVITEVIGTNKYNYGGFST